VTVGIDRAALLDLARLVGVEPLATDALGHTREASDETLLALIEAFGLPPDPARAAAEIAERERSLPFGLRTAQIIDADDPQPIVKLQPSAGNRELAWTCRLETGGETSGGVTKTQSPFSLPLPAGLPLGYHRLAIAGAGSAAEIDLIVAPARCHLPPALQPGARSWGLTCQLYGLRSAHNWGIGDLSDLAELARAAGGCGAAVLGINPLHARFAAEPLHVSPYSPSSRTRLDYLSIDPAAVPGFAENAAARDLMSSDRFGATRWAARTAALIDYGAVAACKRPVLEALFVRFQQNDLGANGAALTAFGGSFREFQKRSGRALADFAVFEALHEHHCRAGFGFSWRGWPAALRNPRSVQVAEFAAAHRGRLEFFEFLQWEAERQLAAAAASARAGGLAVGLYRDLAVGADPNGAEAWADQELVAPSASIGAPPDALSRAGQDWGLAPVNPLVLRRQGFAPFIACLRANMRHAGILRIDHVMSLARLYWIPNGMKATEGCYVGYPFADLLRLVALESTRHRCAVIGEDLGTVPDGFRETMQAAKMLSYRVMAFERRADGAFVPPAEYPALAAASAATHDLATLEGFWLGRDIAWRRKLVLYPDPAAEAADIDSRRRDRRLLLDALIGEGLLTPDCIGRFLPEDGPAHYSPELGDAILRFLAGSRARLMLLQLEDLAGESEQANLPGTTDGHPNWRRRLGRTLDEIAGGTELPRVSALIAEARRRSAAR
jgi:4-alpha-glucanotransferase